MILCQLRKNPKRTTIFVPFLLIMYQTNHLLAAAEEHVSRYIQGRVSPEYVFHDLSHTQEVVRACIEISAPYQLGGADMEILLLAAWWHDTGYDQGSDGHEARSADYAAEWLTQIGASSDIVEVVRACILSTKMPQNPTSLLHQILCDADLSHLGDQHFWDRASRLRQEWSLKTGKISTDLAWIEGELSFLLGHRYHTAAARELFGNRKQKHLRQLRKQQLRLDPGAALGLNDVILPPAPVGVTSAPADPDKEKKKKDKDKDKDKDKEKERQFGRGVETMYRTTYNTHINLSSMADSKANQMLSINTIVISIVVSALVPRLQEMPRLIIPTVILVCVCLTSMVYATLSTRPKITSGNITREDIVQRKGNLLFFGNYFNLPLGDFQFGMTELINDRDYLYATMTRDLYFLGIVLAKKYRLLSLCYNVFMYGLITAMLSFAVAFVI